MSVKFEGKYRNILWNICTSISCLQNVTHFVQALVFNSLWNSDITWWHRSGSTLAQVMACCLTAPNYYLKSWTNVDFSLVRFCGIHLRASYYCVQYNELENYSLKITATSPRGQWVKKNPSFSVDCFSRHSSIWWNHEQSLTVMRLIDLMTNYFSRFWPSTHWDMMMTHICVSSLGYHRFK